LSGFALGTCVSIELHPAKFYTVSKYAVSNDTI
jgi:hypothetical protein